MPFPRLEAAETTFRHARTLRICRRQPTGEGPRPRQRDDHPIRQKVLLSHRQLLQDRAVGGSTPRPIPLGGTAPEFAHQEWQQTRHGNLKIKKVTK